MDVAAGGGSERCQALALSAGHPDVVSVDLARLEILEPDMPERRGDVHADVILAFLMSLRGDGGFDHVVQPLVQVLSEGRVLRCVGDAAEQVVLFLHQPPVGILPRLLRRARALGLRSPGRRVEVRVGESGPPPTIRAQPDRARPVRGLLIVPALHHASQGSARAEQTLALWQMDTGGSSGEENANLYTRGVNEGRAGEVLDGEELLEVLDVFGEDGLRSYLMGHVEGVADAMEDI